MLTPAEISGKEFEKVFFGGYDITGVDELLEAVTADYTALYKENGILKNKLKVLVEKIEEYRSTEDAMRMALLTAQKMGDDLVAEAQRKKSDMLTELEMSAENRRAEIDAQLSDEKARLNAAIEERQKFIGDTRLIIEAHLAFLGKIESVRHTAEPTAPAPTREETIQNTAREIDSAVGQAVYAAPAAAAPVPQPAVVHEASVAQPVQESVAPVPEYEAVVSIEDTISAAVAEAVQIEMADEGDPTRTFMPKAARAEMEETSPRPKFDFDNLKFGVNFEDSK